MMLIESNDRLQNKALVAANEIMNVFDKGDHSALQRARKLADEVFGAGWEAKGADIYKEGPKRATVWGIGRFHLRSTLEVVSL